jgi:hypothetical protein
LGLFKVETSMRIERVGEGGKRRLLFSHCGD